MLTVLIVGAALVILTSIAAARGAAFWSLPATLVVATLLVAALIKHGGPWWTFVVAALAIIVTVIGAIAMETLGWLFTVGLAIVMVVALVFGGVLFAGSPAAASTTSSTTAVGDTLANKLTVAPGDILPATVKCSSDTYSANSIAAVDPKNPLLRTWPYSVTVPFVSSDPTAMMAEMFTEDCVNPTVLDMNVQWLSSLNVQGFAVGTANPWMGEFLAKAGNPGLRMSFLTGSALTADYQSVAAKVNFLLTRFNVIGIGSWQSVSNWHLDGAGLVAGEFPRASLNPNQESLPALRLELTDKGVGCVFAGGFNTADKRWEQFTCVTPVTPSTPAVSKPAQSTPSHKTTSPPAPKPTTTPTCPPAQCLESKLYKNDVTKPADVTKLPADVYQPTAPSAPVAPLAPTTTVHSDTGATAPAQGATPAPAPTSVATTDTPAQGPPVTAIAVP